MGQRHAHAEECKMTMTAKTFYRMALSLGAAPDATNFVIKRDDFVAWMKDQGYAERTINNHAAPSREGGIINHLMTQGLIVDGGVKRWMVPFVQKLNEQKPKRRKPSGGVKTFQGNPAEGDGWITSARLDDGSEDGAEWRLYRKEYAPGCNNLKVAAIGKRVPHKANYWMQARHGKLIMSRDAMTLKQHRPDIFDSLCEELAEILE